jgi:protein-S-isoprenylcysteine O-methyltransferase Ste14
VGTQILMMNVLSTLFFLVTSWFFFNNRIPIEEEKLHLFFGEQYQEYCEKVPIRIPFIKGYEMLIITKKPSCKKE